MSKQKYYSLQSYTSYLARFRWRFAVVITSFIFANLSLAIIPVFMGKLVGVLAASPLQTDQVMLYVIILIACSSGHDFLWHLSEFLYLKLLNSVGFLYENILFRRVIEKPYPYFVDKFTGKISSYITTISQELRTITDNICFNYTSQAVNFITVSIIFTAINWQTGMIFIVGAIGIFLLGRRTIRNSTKYEQLATDVQSTKNGKIIDTIANFVNVKSFYKEHAEITTIKQEQQKAITAANKSFVWSSVFWGACGLFVRHFIWPLTIVLNVYFYIHHKISIGELTTLLSTVLLFSNYIWDIIWNISQFNLKLARAEEAYLYLFGKVNIIAQDSEPTESTSLQLQLNESLSLRNLSFAYPDKVDVAVLKDINLELKKGEKIGVVGKSGSGKSTLTKLLLNYYPLADHTIFLDDQPIPTKVLAQLISYVPQDTSLFHRTIAENIAYATDKKVTRDDIIAAAKQAHADEFIAQINDSYDALVGERGVKLSAGQRQRIAIARAFLDDKPILILDEATSALDSESEILIQEALEALWQKKTVIAIAHRLSTLRHMDRIIVMDQGQMIEQGTHTELLQMNGTYSKLRTHQSGGFLEEE